MINDLTFRFGILLLGSSLLGLGLLLLFLLIGEELDNSLLLSLLALKGLHLDSFSLLFGILFLLRVWAFTAELS